MGWVKENALGLTLLFIYILTWSLLAIDPLSRSDWVLENLLVWLTLPLLIRFHSRLGITWASDAMLFAFYTLHAIGGHWSYSNVPFIPWEEWGFERNHFDRIVHFSFGLLLWLPLRDGLMRFVRLSAVWAGIFALSVIWALSGAYEVIEWGAVAVVSPELGQEFLGVQGDEFDASKDMALAMAGAVIAFGVERLAAWLRAPAPAPARAVLRAGIPGISDRPIRPAVAPVQKGSTLTTRPDAASRRP